MNAVVLVEVVHCIEDLTDRLGSVLLSKLALLANTVEKLSSCRQLGDDVILVLEAVRHPLSTAFQTVCTLDSNQS